MPQGDLRLMAHLMRRAGFGAAREELERYLDIGYEATVEELLFPGDDGLDEDIVQRYYIDIDDLRQPDSIIGWWIYRNVNSRSPLREKMALFYHGLFATRWDKVINTRDAAAQIDMFRRCGLGNFRTLLMELSRDPAMLIFLDNDVNLQATPNENYGRELMELFSMGDGAYTEDDVKACARAFTGWNVSHKIPKVPWGDFPREFEYRPSDHDDGEKTPYSAVLQFMAFTGCRRGEALGLRWSDVDLENGTAAIVQSLQRLKGQGLQFQAPKSAKGRRSIALDPGTVDMLRDHRGRRLLYQIELDGVYQDHGLVFSGPLGGPLDPSVLTRNFEKLARKADLPGVRLHDLRHFHATLMLQEGTNPKIVQERLGHSSFAITMDTYSHVAPGLQEQAANNFAVAMKRAKKLPN